MLAKFVKHIIEILPADEDHLFTDRITVVFASSNDVKTIWKDPEAQRKAHIKTGSLFCNMNLGMGIKNK